MRRARSCVRRKPWSVSLIGGVILLVGCPPPPEFQEADAARSAIHFEHRDFQPELSEYAVRKDPQTGGEVHLASFHGADSLGMLAAIKAGPGYVLRERSPESMVPDLMQDNAEIIWGARGGTMTGVGYAQYRLFQVADPRLSCVGFAQTAGQSGDDQHRKPNAIFGYFCRDEARPMTTQAAEELLAQVKMPGGR